ncbi:MAG TPA: BON domain-containing protein [Gammaproteobacteria bacterium]|nr:BON domain-containing protein [Gammaproteobacteria bacterium]
MEHNERRNQGQQSQGDRSRAGSGRDNDRREFSDDRFGSQRYDEQQREPQRGGSQPEDVYSHRPGSQEFGSPYGSTDDRQHERNFGRHERDYGGSDAGYGARRGYEDQRYRNEQRFSPDWSRDDAQARQSDDPYYARNRGYGEPQGGRAPGGWRGDQDRTTTAEQRERGFEPRGMRRGEQHDADRDLGASYPHGYPWGSRGQESQNRQDEDERHYRGYYSRQYRPFSYPGGSGHLFTESWTLTGPHTGRGPKGWKRSDQQVIEEASQRLERDGEVDATDIEVLAESGVITLRGSVPDRATKRRAEECVESIYGVRDVMNELRVMSRDEESRSARSTQGSQPTSQRSQRGRGAQASQSSQSSQSSSPGARSSGTSPSSASQASQAPSSEETNTQKH